MSFGSRASEDEMTINVPDFNFSQNGILATLLGMWATQVASYVIKSVHAYMTRNKRPTREQFNRVIRGFENQRAVTDKMSMDQRRIYLFLKVIAGDKWPKYFNEVKEIEEREKEERRFQ